MQEKNQNVPPFEREMRCETLCTSKWNFTSPSQTNLLFYIRIPLINNLIRKTRSLADAAVLKFKTEDVYIRNQLLVHLVTL